MKTVVRGAFIAIVIGTSSTWAARAQASSELSQPGEEWWLAYLQRIESEQTPPTLHALIADLAEQYSDIESVRQIMLETRDIFCHAHRGERIPSRNALAQQYWAASGAEPGDEKDLYAARNAYYKSQAQEILQVADRTIAYMNEALDRSLELGAYTATRKRIDQALVINDASTPWPSLYTELCQARRALLFQHPDLAFSRLLVNRHEPGGYSHNCDQYLGRHSRVGRGIAILEDWRTSPRVMEPLHDKLPIGDTARPDISYDGERVLFTFCDHTPDRPSDRRFFLYEAAIDGSWVRQLTGSDDDPMQGWGGRTTVAIEDFDPCYLPDGSIVFTSTRSQNFGRCHGGRYTPSYLLCRCDADGTNIRIISFGEANEHFPTVFHDGRVVFTRWEYINRNQIALHKLWAIRPDGTGVSNFYGVNSASPWARNYHDTHAAAEHWYDHLPTELTSRIHPFMISETRAIPGKNQVVATGATHHAYTAGSLIKIDLDKGEDGFEPIEILTPETPFPEAGDYFTVPGNYRTPYPLNDSLFLAAYSPYSLQKQRSPVPVGEYMIYLVDAFGGREPIYRERGAVCSPMPVIPRPTPPVLPSLLSDDANRDVPGANVEQTTGTLVVQNVNLTRNDPEGLIQPGEIKYLRVCEVVAQPHTGAISAGSREDFARKILGTVPVGDDGFVAFRVPARTPIHLQALDENQMALLTERTLIHVMPGEVRSCIGCHEPVGTAPLRARRINTSDILDLTPPVGPQYEGGFSFIRSVQPVLDRYCIECHGLGDKVEADVNLVGSYTRGSKAPGMPTKPNFDNTDAYSSLTTLPGLVKMALRKGNAGPDSETVNSLPKDYFAHASKLAPMLMQGHEGVELDRESMQRIIDWLDMNCIRYGDYSGNKIEWRKVNAQGENELRAYIAECFGDEIAAQPIQALVNVALIEESRILKAPLAVEAGGWGQIDAGWPSTDDSRYQKMKSLIEAAL